MPRTVVFDETGAPDVLRIVDEPAAEPGVGEVRIKIAAFGVNRLDQLMRSGASPRPLRLPHARLGLEGAGTVDAVGPDVTTVAVGDEVIITAVPDADVNGTYAESTIVPASRVVARPAELDAVGAAALWVAYSTAYGALVEKAGMRPGDHVLVTAASSGVGLAAIQVANQIGAVPLAVTRTAAKRNDLLAAGAAAVAVTEQDDVAAFAREHTGGHGVELILDSVLGPGLAGLARAARFGGTLVTVGWLDPRPASFPANAPLTIHRYMSFEHTLDPAVTRRMAAFFTAGLRTGALRPTVDRVFGLDEIVDAHRYLEQGRHVGKIVVTT
jgi:NADPH:quinone reductase-like Zn-dependent oxidoreductase